MWNKQTGIINGLKEDKAKLKSKISELEYTIQEQSVQFGRAVDTVTSLQKQVWKLQRAKEATKVRASSDEVEIQRLTRIMEQQRELINIYSDGSV